jgi:anti-sigma regulatory factor (Ser/Thr protein kinase)
MCQYHQPFPVTADSDRPLAPSQATARRDEGQGMTNRGDPLSVGQLPPSVRLVPPGRSVCFKAAPSRVLRHAVLALPAQELWVGHVRRFTAALLVHWRLAADERDSAVLIVAELAANAAQHGRSDMILRLTLAQDLLHIEVSDSGDPGRPGTPRTGDPDEHGRGVGIVQALATRIDIRQSAHGRSVHACLGLVAPVPQSVRPAPQPKPTRPAPLGAMVGRGGVR